MITPQGTSNVMGVGIIEMSIFVKGPSPISHDQPTAGIFEFKTTEKGKAALTQYY